MLLRGCLEEVVVILKKRKIESNRSQLLSDHQIQIEQPKKRKFQIGNLYVCMYVSIIINYLKKLPKKRNTPMRE